MARIKLVEGGYASVSPQDVRRIRRWRWHACGFCRHIFRTVKVEGVHEIIYLDAEVVGERSARVYGACNPCPAVPDGIDGKSLSGRQKRR